MQKRSSPNFPDAVLSLRSNFSILNFFNVNNTITTLSPTEQEMTLTFEPAEFKPAFEEQFKAAQAEVQIKGFRKGKVPMDMVKRMLGKEIEADVVESLAGKHFNEAASKENLKLVGKARVRHFEYVPEEKLSIFVQYEVQPEFDLKPYDDYEFKKIVYEISDDDIAREVRALLEEQGVWMSKESEAGADDSVLVDMQRLDEAGMAVIGERFENQEFDLRQMTPDSAIRKALVGAKSGDERLVDLEMPDKNGARRIMKYKVTVKEVKSLDLPELTNELADEISGGGMKTADALRTDIREKLTTYYEQKSEEDLSEEVAQKFVKENSVEIPDSMAKSFESLMIENARQRVGGQFPKGFNIDNFRREIRPGAETMAKWMMIRYKIAEQNNLKVDETDLRAMAEKEAQEIGQPVDVVVESYMSENARDYVVDRILREKVFSFLRTKVKITTETKTIASLSETAS
jgi:trigger factor